MKLMGKTSDPSTSFNYFKDLVHILIEANCDLKYFTSKFKKLIVRERLMMHPPLCVFKLLVDFIYKMFD